MELFLSPGEKTKNAGHCKEVDNGTLPNSEVGCVTAHIALCLAPSFTIHALIVCRLRARWLPVSVELKTSTTVVSFLAPLLSDTLKQKKANVRD